MCTATIIVCEQHSVEKTNKTNNDEKNKNKSIGTKTMEIPRIWYQQNIILFYGNASCSRVLYSYNDAITHGMTLLLSLLSSLLATTYYQTIFVH